MLEKYEKQDPKGNPAFNFPLGFSSFISTFESGIFIFMLHTVFHPVMWSSCDSGEDLTATSSVIQGMLTKRRFKCESKGVKHVDPLFIC